MILISYFVKLSAVIEIARGVDFNSLHALSGTCRQFHAALLPVRNLLVRETLHCENEILAADALEEDADPELVRRSRRLSRDNTSRGRCVRDLVKECTKCHYMVCRVSPNHVVQLARKATAAKPAIFAELHRETLHQRKTPQPSPLP